MAFFQGGPAFLQGWLEKLRDIGGDDDEVNASGRRSSRRREPEPRRSSRRDPALRDAAIRQRGLPQAQGWQPPVSQQPSPLDAAMGFLNSIGGGGGGGQQFDIDAMLRQEFDPQFKAINDRSNFARNNIDSMYRALAGDISRNDPRLAAIFDQAIGSVQNTAKDATRQTINAYDRTSAEQQALLNRLGVSQANPGAQSILDEGENAALGNIQQGRAANEQALNSSKASAQEYNNSREALAGMESKAAQAQVYLQSLAAQQELEQQRAQRGNELSMSAAESQQGGGVDPSNLIDMFQWGFEQNARQAQQQNEMMNPNDAVAQMAMERLPPDIAQAALDMIRQGSFQMDNVDNPGDFARVVGSFNTRRQVPYQILSSLAAEYYMRADPRRGRNVYRDEVS